MRVEPIHQGDEKPQYIGPCSDFLKVTSTCQYVELRAAIEICQICFVSRSFLGFQIFHQYNSFMQFGKVPKKGRVITDPARSIQRAMASLPERNLSCTSQVVELISSRCHATRHSPVLPVGLTLDSRVQGDTTYWGWLQPSKSYDTVPIPAKRHLSNSV